MNPARSAVALLFAINFVNYIDRYVASAVLPLIQAEFHVSDTAAGLVVSIFMVAYMVASPFTGVLGDRLPRRYLVAAGVGLWSLATAASGLATSFRQLLVARSFIGIGEAGFGAVSPTLISDLFPKERRGRMLAYFYVAIPVGSALGFLLGGFMGEHFGWRSAFFLAGAPGLLLAYLATRMHEPARGAGDGVTKAEAKFDLKAALGLARNRSLVLTTLGMAAMTFALGGMASWMPTYLVRAKGLSLDQANTLFGGITVGAGLVGTFLGGWLGDVLQKKTRASYLLVSGVGMLLGVPFCWLGLVSDSQAVYAPAFFMAEVLLFLNTGPANAVLVNVVLPEIRATAIALAIFVYHLLGDVPSPILIGWLSDRSDLGAAIQASCLGAMTVSGVLYLLGMRTLAADQDRVLDTVARREREAVAAPTLAPAAS